MTQSSRIQKIFFLLGLITLSSCGAGVNNSFKELSGDYYFRESGNNFNHISSHNELNKNIYSKISDYDYDADFIVVSQIPDRDRHKSLIASNLNDGKKHISIYLHMADSLLDHDPYYKKIFSRRVNYWIINNKTHELLGPLSFREYNDKREELDVPESVKLHKIGNE